MSINSKQIKFPDVKQYLNKLRNIDLQNASEKSELLHGGQQIVVTLFYLYLMKKYSNNFCVFLRNNQDYKDDGSSIYHFGLYIYFRDGVMTKSNGDDSLQFLSDKFNSCLMMDNTIILIPLDIVFQPENEGHSNMLIYRKFNNTLEHYEPHGHELQVTHKNQINIAIAKLIKRFLAKVNLEKMNFDKIRFVNAEQSCIKLPDVKSGHGFQGIENSVNDKVGYCQSWSFFMFEMCMLNPEFTSREIQNATINTIFAEKDKKASSEKKGDVDSDDYYLANYLVSMIRGYTIIMNEKIRKYFSRIFRFSITERNLNNPDLKESFREQIIQFVSLFLQYNKASEEEVKNEIKTLKRDIKTLTKKQKGKEFLDMVNDQFKKNKLTSRKTQLESVRKLGKAKDSSIFSIDSKTSFHSSVSSFASNRTSSSSRGDVLDYSSESSGYERESPASFISKFDSMNLEDLLSFLKGKDSKELEKIITHDSFSAADRFFDTDPNDTEVFRHLSQRFEKWCQYFKFTIASDNDIDLFVIFSISMGPNKLIYDVLDHFNFPSNFSAEEVEMSTQKFYKAIILTILDRDAPISGGNNVTKTLRRKNKKTKKRKIFLRIKK